MLHTKMLKVFNKTKLLQRVMAGMIMEHMCICINMFTVSGVTNQAQRVLKVINTENMYIIRLLTDDTYT